MQDRKRQRPLRRGTSRPAKATRSRPRTFRQRMRRLGPQIGQAFLRSPPAGPGMALSRPTTLPIASRSSARPTSD